MQSLLKKKVFLLLHNNITHIQNADGVAGKNTLLSAICPVLYHAA